MTSFDHEVDTMMWEILQRKMPELAQRLYELVVELDQSPQQVEQGLLKRHGNSGYERGLTHNAVICAARHLERNRQKMTADQD